MGVYSLSEKNNDILMWSHYADHHKGFCIEYERADSKYNFLSHFMCRPVGYENNYPNLNRVLDVWGINLYTKAVEWEYEAEWRLVFKEGGKIFPSPAPITGIVFGLRMVGKQKATLVESLPYEEGITLYQATRVPGKFALEINETEI